MHHAPPRQTSSTAAKALILWADLFKEPLQSSSATGKASIAAKVPMYTPAKTDDKGTTKEDRSPSMDGITGELPPSLAYWMRRNALCSTNGGGSMAWFMEDNNKGGVKETENEIVEQVLYRSGRSTLPVFEQLCRVKDNDEAISKVKDKDEGKCDQAHDDHP